MAVDLLTICDYWDNCPGVAVGMLTKIVFDLLFLSDVEMKWDEKKNWDKMMMR